MAQFPAGSSGVVVTLSVAPFVIPNGATAQVQISGPGGLTTRAASIAGTSSISFTTTAADFTAAGRYELRAVIMSAGNALYGEFDVVNISAFP